MLVYGRNPAGVHMHQPIQVFKKNFAGSKMPVAIAYDCKLSSIRMNG